MEKIQEENKKLLRSVTELQHEVRQLKEQLAEKDEQLSRSTKRRQIRTVAHMDALTQLNQARADLTVSQDKCSDLEEKLRSGTNDSHQSPEHGDHVELSKKEEALKLQFSEKEQQMEAWMRQRLIGVQEEFQRKLLEEKEKDQREMREREERLRQQLERGMREERDDCLKKQLTTLIESWQTEAQRWRKHQSELEEKLHEQETLRKQQEEERKQETERFQENFQQLWNYIEKKEKKKKKKGPLPPHQANSTHLSAPLQLIPDLPVFILPASPVPQETCLLPVSDPRSASVAPAIICFPGFDSSAWPRLVCRSPLIGTSALPPGSGPLPSAVPPRVNPFPSPNPKPRGSFWATGLKKTVS
ncbi:hypothetical protein D4764_20G0003790 [Takifugu flavidus]|uniref:Uncharacterized protein n=1 Tax=Takifugu flavidus TaxID=433684 RepID=A0A5C6NL05_9TELE|nr:hypothetical protein D4764_20G0003790 [Takifugu flavidus]